MNRRIKRIPGTMPDPKIQAAKEKARILAEQEEKIRRTRPSAFPNKCKTTKDHAIGIYYNYEETELVHLKNENNQYDIDFHPFCFCPYCGVNVKRLIKKICGEK